mmetsp:Transcript_17240/g.49837  ORF Transcript_17240/g.49837 Transcript_17240/m.49837 type:complete len:240 (+) Transcript_17240:2409-3128(+)
MHTRLATFVERGVHTNAFASRLAVGCDLGSAAGSQGDAALNGEAAQARGRRALAAREPQLLQLCAARDLQLGLHDVHARDLLGDGVLDLHPRVDLHEDETRVGIAQLAGDHELHGAHTPVPAALHKAHRAIGDPFPELWVHPRGRHLHDFLISQLHAAIPLEEVGDAALPIGNHLDLDVLRVLEELLEEDRAVTEGGSRFAGAPFEGVLQLALVFDEAHPPAASTEARLEDDGQRDVVL